MAAEVVMLPDSNFRDPVSTLRVIADAIEAGKYGAIGCAALVLLGDKLEVFRTGKDSEAPSVALPLNAGVLRLPRAIEENGR